VQVLVVDDEPAVRQALERALRFEGYQVDTAVDGASALASHAGRAADAIVLDVAMPRMDGLEVCRRLRAAGDRTPVLMLTARSAIDDRVAGLDAGADDYLVKPFALAELEARVRALIRRSHGRDRNVLAHGALTFDTAARSASVGGDVLDLSARELAVLELLLLRSGRVVAKEQFVEHMCGWDQDVTENAIEVYVHRLRRKLEPVGIHVQTVRGLGYYIARA
jgi:two-component system OmpR family response regulator